MREKKGDCQPDVSFSLWKLIEITDFFESKMKKNKLFEERKKHVSDKAKKIVDLSFDMIDKNHELLKSRNIPQKDLFQLPSKSTNMKKEFTVGQLVTIRDLFADHCDKLIEHGKRDLAEKYLDIINVVQSKTGCYEYESLEDFNLNDSGTFSYVEKRKLDELEEVAVDEMIAFAKSYDKEPWETLKTIVNNYLENFPANNGPTYQDTVGRRKLAIQRLIILCIHALNREELKRLDRIVDILSENIHPSLLPDENIPPPMKILRNH